MVRMCQQNKEAVIKKVKAGELDMSAVSRTDFVDEIILTMNSRGILQCLEDGIDDKRASNTSVPFRLILANAIAAKMKTKTSLTDIPTAISDHKVLAELGYTLIDTSGNLRSNMMREGGLRYLLDKYLSKDWFNGYNNVVKNHIMPKMNLQPNIHILDTTIFEVNIKNENYEESTIGKNKQNKSTRGYKLATIRGVTGDSGIIEEIKFGDLKTHDVKFCREMVMKSPVLNPGDILINDRGFIDKEFINFLKLERNVDVYIPLRNDMDAYEVAVSAAMKADKWVKHPNPNRKNQKIAFVAELGQFWTGGSSSNADLNACVVWDTKADRPDKEYFVFVTTDLEKTAKQIVQTYELRCEVEEDYRQIKDMWQIESFNSTRINMIAFHVVCMLFGYLFFQLFTLLPEGEDYQHKSLPIILKNFESKYKPVVVLFCGNKFGIFTLSEFARLYLLCEEEVRKKIDAIVDAV